MFKFTLARQVENVGNKSNADLLAKKEERLERKVGHGPIIRKLFRLLMILTS